jgi:hypothetical protein
MVALDGCGSVPAAGSEPEFRPASIRKPAAGCDQGFDGLAPVN